MGGSSTRFFEGARTHVSVTNHLFVPFLWLRGHLVQWNFGVSSKCRMGCLLPVLLSCLSPFGLARCQRVWLEVLFQLQTVCHDRSSAERFSSQVYAREDIGTLAGRRIPDVKSKGGIDTRCLAEHHAEEHPPEVARWPIW